MATKAATIVRVEDLITVTWATFNGDDTGAAVDTAGEGRITDAMTRATGDFNAQTLDWQGSFDGTDWFTLVDADGSVMSGLQSPAYREIRGLPRYIRPDASGAMTSGVMTLQFRRAD